MRQAQPVTVSPPDRLTVKPSDVRDELARLRIRLVSFRNETAEYDNEHLESGQTSTAQISVRQRIGPQLEVHSHWLVSLAAFRLPRRAIAAGCP